MNFSMLNLEMFRQKSVFEETRMFLFTNEALQIFKDILDDKRKDCINANSSTQISENRILIRFMKNSLGKSDPKLSQISEGLCSDLIKNYLDSPDLDLPSLQKLIIKSQLTKMVKDTKLPKEICQSLDELLQDHISTTSQLFPIDKNLKKFIQEKIPDLFMHFTDEGLEDYLTFTFHFHSNHEVSNFFCIDLRSLIESRNDELEISDKIIAHVSNIVGKTTTFRKKIKIFENLIDQLSDLIKNLQKKLRKKSNYVMHLVSIEISKLIDHEFGENLKKRNNKTNSSNEEREIIILRSKILLEQIRLAHEFQKEITKLVKYEEIMNTIEEKNFNEEKKQFMNALEQFLKESDDNLIDFDRVGHEFNQKRNKIIEKVQDLHQEMKNINEIYVCKARKLKKNSYNAKFFNELKEENYVSDEKSIFFVERKLFQEDLRLKLEENFLDDKIKNQPLPNQEKIISFRFIVQNIILNVFFLVLGIILYFYF